MKVIAKTASRIAHPVSFAAVLSGMLFFFNPQFAALDLLPDFIGCLLIFFGLSRVARINRQTADTRKLFLRLFIFYFCKDIATFIVFGMTTDAERPVALLLVSFLSALLGYYLAFGAFRDLFESFYALSVLRECPALYGKHRQLRFFRWKSREYSRPELACFYTLVFLAIREIFAVLPEFAALTTSSYFDSGLDRLYDFIGVMRLFAAFFALIFGVIWLVLICRFFSAVKKERAFRTQLGEEEHAWRLCHPNQLRAGRIAFAFVLMGVGAFFLADFRIDLQNVLPDALAALFFLAGILLCSIPGKNKLALSLACVAFGAIATVSERYAAAFAYRFNPSAISKMPEAADAYFAMWGTALIELIAFLALLLLLLFSLRTVIAEHAGYLATHSDLEFELRRREAYLQEFDGELIRVFLFGFIAALVSFLYDYIQEIPNKRVFRLLEFLWGIDLCFNVAFALLFAALLSNIYKEICKRFIYEA